MKAVGLTRYLPLELPDSLQDFDVPVPAIGERDVLVAVKAVAVNPLDNRVRKPKDKIESTPRILGWDVAGTVVEVGAAVTRVKQGDKVYYAGDLGRPGGYSEFHAVDERIVAHMPASLDFESAAGLPLSALTAWEALFDRLAIAPHQEADRERKSILIIGAAGGVGSMAVQLAARYAGLQVIATASRPQSEAWVRELGASHVVNHFGDIPAQIRELEVGPIDYVLLLGDTAAYFQVAAEVVAPQGKICAAVEASAPVDLNLLWDKSITLVWEMVFTRTDYQTADMERQGHILAQLADLIDAGVLRTTVAKVLQPINSTNVHHALATLRQGHVSGKIVLSGFDG
ncbi:zinc-binding alcohol dehydrogenase family protein [Massilia sp. 9I]|uniref:zinc-binding alcohol dehydrogenase family protein n=1 Tax=Massilia sp. 9I TaxID=2653152 RepID=UPI0012F31D01|nr:zinc-binding alcohol dehydrogenase family protein [Massilia sp. 9I]VXC48199.1 Zinc-type alcohol dehydrogenase-like protein [Massilia sp. 9I]